MKDNSLIELFFLKKYSKRKKIMKIDKNAKKLLTQAKKHYIILKHE